MLSLHFAIVTKKITFDFMKSNNIEYYIENIWHHPNSVQLRKHFDSIVHTLFNALVECNCLDLSGHSFCILPSDKSMQRKSDAQDLELLVNIFPTGAQ